MMCITGIIFILLHQRATHFWYFWRFFAASKKLSKNLSARIILVLDATFVPNLTLSGLLRPEISFGEKTVTHLPTHPVHFTIGEPQSTEEKCKIIQKSLNYAKNCMMT